MSTADEGRTEISIHMHGATGGATWHWEGPVDFYAFYWVPEHEASLSRRFRLARLAARLAFWIWTGQR